MSLWAARCKLETAFAGVGSESWFLESNLKTRRRLIRLEKEILQSRLVSLRHCGEN